MRQSQGICSTLGIERPIPKYVVTLDNFWQDNVEGVRHVYLPDFLLMETY